MQRARCRASWALLCLLSPLFLAPAAYAQTVTVTVGSPGDRWLDTMQFTRVARGQRDRVFGYQVTYHAASLGDFTLFWPRSHFDFDGSKPGYRLLSKELERGRLLYPDRITAKSLPAVYRAVLMIDRDYEKQANGAIAAAEAFGVVATLGAVVPSPRLPASTASTAKPSTAGLSAGELASARSNSTALADNAARGFVELDTNAVIAAVEGGKATEILGGRAPSIPITVAKEFLRRGSAAALREFLQANGGRLAAAGTEASAAELRALAASMGRALALGDARVAASAAREGVTIITNDRRFAGFLRAAGFTVEGF